MGPVMGKHVEGRQVAVVHGVKSLTGVDFIGFLPNFVILIMGIISSLCLIACLLTHSDSKIC